MTGNPCRVCRNETTTGFLQLEQVPVHCNILWATVEEARRAPRGEIRLAFCGTCGMVYNEAFDSALTEYEATYENSLHYSPRFQEYARELAAYLTRRYELTGRSIVEIGCGKGEFLELLCDTASASGLGFDPTYEPDGGSDPRTTVIQDFYTEAYAEEAADLICCRHTLEHIAEPREFLERVRRAIGDRTHIDIFFEVPNALFTLRDLGIWDIIYEHCSYFTPTSLRRIFEDSGFAVERLAATFGDQFLIVEARPAASTDPREDRPDREVEALRGYVDSFAQVYRSSVEQWQERLSVWSKQGTKTALWGAGSKGVTFLNTVRGADEVTLVVDVNPRKQGRRVPGTAQQVVSPESLRHNPPDVVIVMNPIYVDEIRAALSERGLDPEIVQVGKPGVRLHG